MSKGRRILAACLLTGFVLANCVQLGGGVGTDPLTQQAQLLPWLPIKLVCMTAQYETTPGGAVVFKGCWGPPSNCWVATLPSLKITISPEGIQYE